MVVDRLAVVRLVGRAEGDAELLLVLPRADLLDLERLLLHGADETLDLLGNLPTRLADGRAAPRAGESRERPLRVGERPVELAQLATCLGPPIEPLGVVGVQATRAIARLDRLAPEPLLEAARGEVAENHGLGGRRAGACRSWLVQLTPFVPRQQREHLAVHLRRLLELTVGEELVRPRLRLCGRQLADGGLGSGLGGLRGVLSRGIGRAHRGAHVPELEGAEGAHSDRRHWGMARECEWGRGL